MISRIQPILLAVLAISVAGPGCARMAVEVQVLDQGYLEDPAILDRQMRSDTLVTAKKVKAAINTGRFDREAKEQIDEVVTGMEALRDAGGLTPADTAQLIGSLRKSANEKVAKSREAYEAGVQLVKEGNRQKDADARTEKLREASDRFGEGERTLAQLRNELNHETDSLAERGREAILERDPAAKNPGLAIAMTTVEKLEVVETAETKVEESIVELGSIIPGKVLFDDPMVSAVVHAPKRYWQNGEESPFKSWRRNARETLYNETKGGATFGNADIAIKMESASPGNFTLKGLRLDSRKVTQATFKALRTGIELAAMMYGVPVPKRSGVEGDDAMQQASDTFVTGEDQRRAAEQQRREVRRATVAIMDSIVGEAPALTDPTKFAAASASIRSVYAAYRPRLQPAAAGSSTGSVDGASK